MVCIKHEVEEKRREGIAHNATVENGSHLGRTERGLAGWKERILVDAFFLFRGDNYDTASNNRSIQRRANSGVTNM
jgi:hypothetical protein